MDPITAITAATTAYQAIVKAVQVGQEAEATFTQMGKWYTAVADFRRIQTENKNPPIFKKLFAAGSVEEEALQILLHEKKIAEQEKDLETMLNWRYGANTWKELLEMRRRIKKEREETLYKQRERQRKLVDAILIIVILGALGSIITAGAVLIMGYKGML